MSAFSEQAARMVAGMTIEEKAGLCSGNGWWNTKAVDSVGLGSIMMTDGPHGLRKQVGDADHLGMNPSAPATCFPTASATGAGFDRELVAEVGQAIAEEATDQGVSMVLGPGVNMKRSPLCGRNFEYFSEDPYLSGELAASMVTAIQSQGVGTSLKHFAANNQEKDRMTSDSVVDERALREIYLQAFEKTVKTAQPRTVMCSYNRLNGAFASQNWKLLTGILRDEWGFQGAVVSDWGAVDDRVSGLRAGLDLQMPGSEYDDQRLVAAVDSGALSEADLDRAATRIVELVLQGLAGTGTSQPVENGEALYQRHHELARKAAARCAVLLKNDDSILPISHGKNVAVIGEFARKPRFQGAGSSRINPTRVDDAVDELTKAGFDTTYAAGYDLEMAGEEQGASVSKPRSEELIEEAVRIAMDAEVAVVFAGLPDEYESEGFDRDTLDMPESHNRLIEAVAQANPNTVVVLMCGAPVVMPWMDDVKAVLLAYLGGQGVGGAVADLLSGAVNPSGKLAETFPLALRDNPSYHYFATGAPTEEYRESIFIGYRYYDTANIAVAFPFGYGLSYTQFEYGSLEFDGAKARIQVKNAGQVAGAEVVQLYIAGPDSKLVFRPEKQLCGFAKVMLAPGESASVEFSVDDRAFQYYNVMARDWATEAGDYTLLVGSSSADIRDSVRVHRDGDGLEQQLAPLATLIPRYFAIGEAARDLDVLTVPANQFRTLYRGLRDARPLPPRVRDPKRGYDRNSTLGELRNTAIGKGLYAIVRKQMLGAAGEGSAMSAIALDRQLGEMPIRSLVMTSDGAFTWPMAAAVLAIANHQPALAAHWLLRFARSARN
jgi:beta-glucosidase